MFLIMGASMQRFTFKKLCFGARALVLRPPHSICIRTLVRGRRKVQPAQPPGLLSHCFDRVREQANKHQKYNDAEKRGKSFRTVSPTSIGHSRDGVDVEILSRLTLDCSPPPLETSFFYSTTEETFMMDESQTMNETKTRTVSESSSFSTENTTTPGSCQGSGESESRNSPSLFQAPKQETCSLPMSTRNERTDVSTPLMPSLTRMTPHLPLRRRNSFSSSAQCGVLVEPASAASQEVEHFLGFGCSGNNVNLPYLDEEFMKAPPKMLTMKTAGRGTATSLVPTMY